MFGGFMRTRVLTLLAAATAAVAAPQAASAASIIGSFSGALLNVTSSAQPIAAGSTFDAFGGVVSSTSGGFVGQGGLISLNPVTASAGSLVSITTGFGSFAGKVISVTTPTNAVNFIASGLFTSTIAGFTTPSKSTVTFGYTQTGGAGAAISGSFTLDSKSAVPEPATWGMMIAGAGMAGAALRRRRTSKKVAVA